jgi:hypothetical protein
MATIDPTRFQLILRPLEEVYAYGDGQIWRELFENGQRRASSAGVNE